MSAAHQSVSTNKKDRYAFSDDLDSIFKVHLLRLLFNHK